ELRRCLAAFDHALSCGGSGRRRREGFRFYLVTVQAHVAVRLLRMLSRLIANNAADYLNAPVEAALRAAFTVMTGLGQRTRHRYDNDGRRGIIVNDVA